MNEADFILKLQKRAKDQEAIIHAAPFPKFFSVVSIWLGRHPWRFIVPFSFLLTIILRIIFDEKYTNFILSLFRNL